MIKASVAIGTEQTPIEGYAIQLNTPVGVVQIGIDNNGRTYLSSVTETLVLHPRSANRILLDLER